MLYLITVSDHYYPQGGTGDWKLLTADEHKARTAWHAFEGDNRVDLDHVAYLIRLSPDGTYTILDVR